MKRLALVGFCVALSGWMSAAEEVKKRPDGLVVELPGTTLLLEVLAPNIVRVACAPDPAFFTRESFARLPRHDPPPPWDLTTTDDELVLATERLRVKVDRRNGAVRFFDPSDNLILAERAGGRTLQPAQIQGERVLQVRQIWEPNAGESLYGLGQHQYGLLDLKGRDLDLWQHNTSAAVPVLVSSRGYGLLWDQASYTRFGDVRDPEAIPAACLVDADGEPGALTATYFADPEFGRAIATRREARIDIEIPQEVSEPNKRLHPDLPATAPVSVRWTGAIVPAGAGDYTLWPYSNAGLKVWLDGRIVVDHWRQGWLPGFEQARVRLEAGRRHELRVDWLVDQGEPTLKLFWKTPPPDEATSLWSEAADGLDYTFVYGPSLDDVVGGYRQVTGRAAMLPVWAFGLWQSRERYRTQQQSLDVLARQRELGAPLDVIVQDWFYWREAEWGSHEFDPARFPDPAGWIRAIHDRHARLLISVWPKFYAGTRHFEEMKAGGFLYRPNLDEGIVDWVNHPFTFYDAFNPDARTLFWAQMERELFRKGVDAWWLDASEPDMRHIPTLENVRLSMDQTARGSASRVMLAYPLVHIGGVYDGQRAAAPDRRVCLLTRCAYSGLQRYGAATWSGDISSTWTAFRKQIPAGLGFALSGLPYWTTDSGGFAVPPRWSRRDEKSATPDEPIMTPAEAAEWAELNTRWLQFATFCPLMRSHGQFPFREIWQFGGPESPACRAQLKSIRLRYRLLPYVYSLAGGVTHDHNTMMRPLVMDFRDDPAARAVGDAFMFGPALLVAPVMEYQARQRPVYLPATPGGWYDFWSGKNLDGGRTVDAAAPFDSIPVHVRAGAIVPVGPDRQYATEEPKGPLTIYVYTGADGAFSLYQDDGVSHGYERGEFARVPLRWDEASRTLTLGAREGSFPGLPAEQTIQVVFVAPARPVGFSFEPAADREVVYRGEAVSVQM